MFQKSKDKIERKIENNKIYVWKQKKYPEYSVMNHRLGMCPSPFLNQLRVSCVRLSCQK